MSSVRTSTAAVHTTKGHSAKMKATNQQRIDDQERQFREFLDDWTKDGSRIPSHQGKPSVGPLLTAAGMSYYLYRKSSKFRLAAEEYAERVGYTTVAEFRKQLSPPPPAATLPGSEMTYQELLDLTADDLRLKSPKSLPAYKSGLSRWIAVIGKTPADQVGPEMAGEYEQALTRFIEKKYKDDHKNARAAKSYLKKYKRIVEMRQLNDGLPASLHAAVTQLVRSSGRTAAKLSRAIGMHESFINHLMTGQRKTAPSEKLTLLEDELQVESGTLTNRASYHDPRLATSFCPMSRFPAEWQGHKRGFEKKCTAVRRLLPDHFPFLPEEEQHYLLKDAIDDVSHKRHQTKYGSHLSEVTQLPYALKLEQMTSELRQEHDDFIKFKHTRGSLEKGKTGRKKIWKPGTKGSERRWKSTMGMFFGWCMLPLNAPDPKMRGAGLRAGDLTLGLLVVPELITEYIGFRYARADNKDTGTIMLFLADCLAMLRTKSGWVQAHPKFLQRIPAELQQASSTWKEQCEAQFIFISEASKDRNPKKVRDSFLPIKALLDMGRPMDIVEEALANNLKELKSQMRQGAKTPRQIAVMFRNHVLVSMLAALPLRASHWANMTYLTNSRTLTTEEGGELRQLEDHHWGLYLLARDFKNYKNEAIFGPNSDRNLDLTFSDPESPFKALEPLIDEYMRDHRPKLCQGNGPVFPNTHGDAMTEKAVSEQVHPWTERYLSENGDRTYGLCITGVKSFRPHAFRHVVASHVLMTTGSYQDAANMLLDSVEIIKSTYGMYLPKERMRGTFARLDIKRADRS